MIFCIEVKGIVQGVGFRPFIYDLAVSNGLSGEVSNRSYGALILLETTKEMADSFVEEIWQNKLPLCEIDSIVVRATQRKKAFKRFSIEKSQTTKEISSKIPFDIAMCDKCKDELFDKSNRRYRYPFITCTDCGPRYSIIKNLPYDRENSSMSKFPICKECRAEYEDPKNRRYHAQSIGCHKCGVILSLYNNSGAKIESKDSVGDIIEAIKEGKIVAIKGVGGYHLLCDATHESAVKLLRERKRRPSKPFAIMIKTVENLKKIAYVSKMEEDLISSNKRPIVLLKKRDENLISSFVAPNIDQIGVFLPYTPLHHLVFQKVDFPLVATSANISGEPICKNFNEIMKLSTIWDLCLDHNMEILNSCDDSVFFVECDKTFMLRGSRGYAPISLKLPQKSQKRILALGANQKSTVALITQDSVILSPYIGDLQSFSSVERFKSTIDRLREIYGFHPDAVVCDKHPNYESTKFAKELVSQNKDLKLLQVQHHYAHILATMGVNGVASKVLGVSFDGTGYGDDGNLWGGEFFVCESSSYKRVGHFKYFRLLGGEKAIKEPRRVALNFLFELYGDEIFKLKNPTVNAFCSSEIKALYALYKSKTNSVLTSSCGRVFDAVASVLGIVEICSYEGESGLMLESYYDENIISSYLFEIEDGEIDFSKIFYQIVNETDVKIAVSKFFNTIVEIIYEMYKKYDLPLVLGGGVFQNRVLLRLIIKKIPNTLVPHMFLSNDSAIAYGQAIATLQSKTI